jgi:phospholipid transport system substrate-binding protein
MRSNRLKIIELHFSPAKRAAYGWFRSAVLVLTLLLASSASSFATTGGGSRDGEAKAIVMTTVAQAVKVLDDRHLSQEARRQKLIAVVADHFDFTDMARSSLGYHWRQLTSDQQQRFVLLFTAFIEQAYLNKLEEYSDQKVRFLGQSSVGPDRSQVNTLVMQPNEQQPIHLDYRLKRHDNQWKVYDVTVDNISITANYRSQFNHVINNQGFDVLMKKMENKQQELLASLGK